MSSQKLTSLPTIAAIALTDPFYVVDLSLGVNGSSQISYSDLFGEIIRDVSVHLADAITNTLSTVFTVRHSSSGSVVDGFGSRTEFRLESDSNGNRLAGALDVYWMTAADATRTSALSVSLVNSGSDFLLLQASPSSFALYSNAFAFDPSGLLRLGISGSIAGKLDIAGSTSGLIRIQGAAVAGSYTLTLPVNDGSSGQFLQTDGSGVLSWQTVSAAPGGSDTQFQYNNSSAFAGSANFAYVSSALAYTRNSIGATSTDGMILQNTAAAAAGAQQWSPRLRFTGQGWKTDATAASQTVDCIIELVPVQEGPTPGGHLSISTQINGGGFTERVLVSAGVPNQYYPGLYVGGYTGGSYIPDLNMFAIGDPVSSILFNGANCGLGITKSSLPAIRLRGVQLLGGDDNYQIQSNGLGHLSLTPSTDIWEYPDRAVSFKFGTTSGVKIGTATGQKIGFWNATPVIQQVLATGGGATVDNVISLLQTLGLCKQS